MTQCTCRLSERPGACRRWSASQTASDRLVTQVVSQTDRRANERNCIGILMKSYKENYGHKKELSARIFLSMIICSKMKNSRKSYSDDSGYLRRSDRSVFRLNPFGSIRIHSVRIEWIPTPCGRSALLIANNISERNCGAMICIEGRSAIPITGDH